MKHCCGMCDGIDDICGPDQYIGDNMRIAYKFICQYCPAEILYHAYPEHLGVEGCPNCKNIPTQDVQMIMLED